MKRHSMRSVIVGLTALLGLLTCGLQEVRSEEVAKPAVDDFNIESRHVDIWSDGTRISGDLWYPRGLKSGYKFPAVILCHGWGGVRSHFNQAYASEFAAAGYIVLTFDYRGWGEIDPVPQNVNKIGRLKGTPYLSRIAKYHPVDFANLLKTPILIIVAEKEELMDNKLHGERVYNIVKGIVPAQYVVFSGTHFEIYGKGRKQAIQMAIEWFDKHL